MIVVDTNVVSEPLRPRPDERVLTWLSSHSAEIVLTSITVGELTHGVARLPDGARKDGLRQAVERLVSSAGDRVLDYDRVAARLYGQLRAAREAGGRPGAVEDLMIAAICLAHGHALATRNIADFEDSGVELINPWGRR